MIETAQSYLDWMKYVCNHPYKFDGEYGKFFTTFLNYILTIWIEVANILVLMMTPDPLDLVSNFVSLVVITQFDELVYASMKDEPCKKLIEKEFTEKCFCIEHTSSRKASHHESADVINQDGYSRPLRISFRNRTCGNRCMFITYKICRCFYVSIYFYYLPFIAMIVGLSITTLMRGFVPACD